MPEFRRHILLPSSGLKQRIEKFTEILFWGGSQYGDLQGGRSRKRRLKKLVALVRAVSQQ
jgi:hypothetical protein